MVYIRHMRVLVFHRFVNMKVRMINSFRHFLRYMRMVMMAIFVRMSVFMSNIFMNMPMTMLFS